MTNTTLIQTLQGIRDEYAHERNAWVGYVPLFADRAQKKVDALNTAIETLSAD